MKKAVFTSVLVMCVLNMTACSSASKGGASSEEAAVHNFAKAFLNADINGCLAVAAPDAVWDYVTDKKGLTTERLFYEVSGLEGDAEFKEAADNWKEGFKEDNLTADNLEIEYGSDMDNDVFSLVSLAINNAGVDGTVSEVRWIEIKDSGSLDGMSYCLDGKWYYGPEWLIEDVIEIAYGDD